MFVAEVGEGEVTTPVNFADCEIVTIIVDSKGTESRIRKSISVEFDDLEVHLNLDLSV